MPPAASARHAMLTRRRCCPMARCWWQGEITAAAIFSERGTVRSGERDMEPPPAASNTARAIAHGDVAAQWEGARRGGSASSGYLRERGNVRSGQRDVDGHRQPRHRTLKCHTATLLPNGKVLVAGGSKAAALSSQRGTVRPGQRDMDGHRQPRHRTRCSHGDVAAQRQGAGRRRDNGNSGYLSERGTVRPGQRDLEPPPATSSPDAIGPRRRCCPTARCSWQRDRLPAGAFLEAPNYATLASGLWNRIGSRKSRRQLHPWCLAAASR